MKWDKLGQLFVPSGQHAWMRSHAANPVAEQVGPDEYRVYFGCRDGQNRTHIGWIEIKLHPDPKVLRIAGEPALAPGSPGHFDDSGTSMGWVTPVGEKTYLYYIGWNLGVTVPWRNSIGLAVRSTRDGAFVKHSPAPLVDRSAIDPFTISYPCVLREENRWRMWYGSHLSWKSGTADMNHVIKYAESSDGLNWERQGIVAIDLQLPKVYALCRPSVLKDGGLYRMWYAYRGGAYRIGYAESADGIHWERLDHRVGIDVSSTGWDSDMIEYPFVFDHDGERYMLYNGNRYGETGLGLAILAA